MAKTLCKYATFLGKDVILAKRLSTAFDVHRIQSHDLVATLARYVA